MENEKKQGTPLLDKTFVFCYDDIGNITGVETYGYTAPNVTPTGTPTTETFTYGDATYVDRLTKFDTKAIAYNANGEMTSFDGKSYSWNKGKLSSVTETVTSGGLLRAKPGLPTILGNKAYSFSYNAFGQRTAVNYTYTVNAASAGSIAASEVVAYAKRFYYDHAGRLMFETKTSTSYSLGDAYYKIAYLYDQSSMIGIEYTKNGQSTLYYFQRNLQGDVVGIYDTDGNLKVRYIYDAWGNCTIDDEATDDMTLAYANPIRYRGYYYDQDTGLYYLNARYYNPELRRFISPDDTAYLDPESVDGLNLYAYCYNDPVNYADPSGHLAVSTFVWIIIGAAVLTTAGVVTYGAITDRPIVLDFSFSAGMGAGVGGKIGLSVVLDFKNNSLGFYPHYGYYYGAKFNVFGFSYGVGFISNYENEGDYAGPFISFGGGLYGGIDHCYDPRYLYNDTVRASSITFGKNKGGYYGYDYYDYWRSVSF